MEFRVLNVGHGACAYLQADNTNVMLFDCGHNSDPEFRPSTHLPARGHQSVEYLFISNYDQDHISDLPRLRNNLHIGSLVRNASITADQLRALKLRQSGEISPAMHSMLDMIHEVLGSLGSEAPPMRDDTSFEFPLEAAIRMLPATVHRLELVFEADDILSDYRYAPGLGSVGVPSSS